MDLNEWIKDNNNCAAYSHFDYKVSLSAVFDKISDPSKIITHSFKPFIHSTLNINKYNNKKKKRETKKREVYWASHYDKCIYQYYSLLINEKYNDYVKKEKINYNSLAYRNNLKKNNVHFAKQAFAFIKENPNSIIFIGDFTNFFDNLEHNYLKSQLCKVLNVTKLPDDYYSLFKNITKFSSVELNDIEKIRNELGITDKKKLISLKEIRKRPELIKQNNLGYGVPQGVAISSILSNVYMVDFDKKCKNLVQNCNGIYLRYSDDFIIVFPNKEIMETNQMYNKIITIVNSIPKLSLSKEKTKIYFYNNNKIINCENEIGKEKVNNNIINYLGFSFDGKKVSIRDKTISKYYYRTYRKIKTINNQRRKNLKGQGTTNIYLNYSVKGTYGTKLNFISYVKKCINIFGKKENVHKVFNSHMGKIKKRLIR